MSLVSFTKTSDGRDSSIKRAIAKSLNLIDYQVPRDVEKIVIKPNLNYYWDYSTGQTTDPRFIALLVDTIRDKVLSNAKITLVESDASAMKCRYSFKILGYETLARERGLDLINLSQDKSQRVAVNVGKDSFIFRVPQTIADADLKINVTKLKYTMETIKLTCALKNIFGCNPYPKKFKYHKRLDETIVALNKIMKFDLCLVDGLIVSNSGVAPRKLGLVMASRDPVAVDVAAARILDVNPRLVKYIRLAAQEGIGDIHFIPKGISLRYFRERFPHKDLNSRLMSKAYAFVMLLGLGESLGLD